MKTGMVLCTLLLWAASAAGCAYDRAIVVSSEKPAWVTQKPPNTKDKFVYVGEGYGGGIVDSRRASTNAMEDVCRQMAGSLTHGVVEQAITIAEQNGAPHQDLDADCATYGADIRQQVSESSANLQQDGFYWEKWAHKAGLFDSPTYQYRYYILASMTREAHDKLVTQLIHRIADAIEARTKKTAASVAAGAGTRPATAAAAPKP